MVFKWERGYRIHGYWDEEGKARHGHVGLTPRITGGKTKYIAEIDIFPQGGHFTFDTLSAAKKHVEDGIAAVLEHRNNLESEHIEKTSDKHHTLLESGNDRKRVETKEGTMDVRTE